MEFNTTTFILEIVNFLILIWILQRLFYKPVLEVIAKRKLHIDQSLDDAKKLRNEADELRAFYENRQQLWEQERKAAQAAFQLELDSEKNLQFDQLHKDLDLERQKAFVAFNRQQEEWRHQTEKQALINGARFASLLLRKAAGPEVEARLLELLLEQLNTLPEAARLSPQITDSEKNLIVKVASVFPLSAELKQKLEKKLLTLINHPMGFQYQQEQGLIAGIRMDIGAWVLHVNLENELAGFAAVAYESE